MIYAAAAFVALILSFVAWELSQNPKRRRALEETRAKQKQSAQSRGWQLDITSTPNSAVYKYGGTTDGIRWECHTESWTARGRGHRTEKVFSRWSTSDAKFEQGLVAIWPSFGEAAKIDVKVPDFVLNLILGPLMKSLNGTPEEREMLISAQPVQDSTLDGHYLLRATDPSAMQRFLDNGARDALRDAAAWLPVRNTENHLILAVVTNRGVSILLQGWIADEEKIARISELGARLATSSR